MQKQQWKKYGTNFKTRYRHGNWRKSETKMRWSAEARKKGHIVHFASLVDLCHLKNSELEPQFQKYKGRVALRSDIVKDDSGSYAVFTEQGSSASQMTAAKVVDVISRLPSRRSICLHPSENGRCTIIIEDPKIRMSRIFGYVCKTQMA